LADYLNGSKNCGNRRKKDQKVYGKFIQQTKKLVRNKAHRRWRVLQRLLGRTKAGSMAKPTISVGTNGSSIAFYWHVSNTNRFA
jgi:hypothetical protein